MRGHRARRPVIRLPFLAMLLAASACGGGRNDELQVPPEELANIIANLSTVEEKEVKPPPRLGVLAEADVPAELTGGGACRFYVRDRLVAVAGAEGAIARIDGAPKRLFLQGPVGPSGGFFAAGHVTLSIGRRAPPDAEGRSTAAGITVGGDPRRPVERLEGSWVCTR